nr:MAG TPA: hypothetical protein [Caudoviricetes sp.]
MFSLQIVTDFLSPVCPPSHIRGTNLRPSM